MARSTNKNTAQDAEPAWTALHWAAAEGREDVCSLLVAAAADPGQTDRGRQTDRQAGRQTDRQTDDFSLVWFSPLFLPWWSMFKRGGGPCQWQSVCLLSSMCMVPQTVEGYSASSGRNLRPAYASDAQMQ